MDRLGEDCSAALFAAGAYSVASGAGMDSKDAGRFVSEVCKQAASRRIVVDDDDDDDDTWWSRNKHWALPVALASGAFLVGNDIGRKGYPDRNLLHNTASWAESKLKALFGIVDDPMMNRFTDASKPYSRPERPQASTDLPSAEGLDNYKAQ